MERGEVVEMGTPWELIRPDGPESDASVGKTWAHMAQDSGETSSTSSGTTLDGSSKGKGKEVEKPADAAANAQVAVDDHHVQAVEVEDEADAAARKAKDAMKQEQKKKRWFREMCEMSGEMSALLEEAKKSFEAKRLVDVDES